VCGNNNSSNTTTTSFSCAIWDLVLTVAVGVVDYNRLSFDDTERLNASKIAAILRNYVDAFGFADCRRRDDHHRKLFLKLYDGCEFDRCNVLPGSSTPPQAETANDELTKDSYLGRRFVEKSRATPNTKEEDWRQLALWLAKVRQSITKSTLSKSGIKRNEYWPTKQDCPGCWKGRTQHNPELLYKYLKIVFGNVDEVTHQYRHELQLLAKSKLKHGSIQFPQASFLVVVVLGVIVRFKSLISSGNATSRWLRRRRKHLVRVSLDAFEDPHMKLD